MNQTHAHQKHSQANHLQYLPITLVSLSIIMMVISVGLIKHYLGPAYFAISGKPLEWSLPKPAVQAVALPSFTTSQSISSASLTPGSTLSINISATSDRQVDAIVQAWVTSPKHKQVWRSAADKVTSFTAGQSVALRYAYPLPATLRPGTYKVSLRITSTDGFTDYAVKEDYAEFTVQ